MSKRDEKILVEDIIEAAERISRYTNKMSLQEFLADEKTEDAVARNFGIIGEAASKLSIAFKDKYPEIEWKKLTGTRNRIIHDYIGIDYSILWNIAQHNIPVLIQQLKKILEE